eukprot:scaffold610_cov64-Phaeocystis_antarctica.AAC.3
MLQRRIPSCNRIKQQVCGQNWHKSAAKRATCLRPETGNTAIDDLSLANPYHQGMPRRHELSSRATTPAHDHHTRTALLSAPQGQEKPLARRALGPANY